MFSQNSGVNLLNNWQKVAPSLLSCCVVSALIIICAGYVSNNKNHSQQLQVARKWYENYPLDKGDEDEDIIKPLIESIQNEMTTIHQYLINNISKQQIDSKIKELNLTSIKYKTPFVIGQKPITNVNLEQPIIVYSGKRIDEDKEKPKLKDDEKKIISNFSILIEERLYEELKNLEEISSSDGSENFRQYSEKTIRYFSGSNYSKKLPYLKAESIYLANKNGVMAWYPSQRVGIPIDDFLKRPWARAAWGKDNNKFRSDYVGKNSNTGLTSPYTDINDKVQPIVIRTLWYKFRTQNTDNTNNNTTTNTDDGYTDYVLCLDLLFDLSSQFDTKTNLLEKYANSGLVIQLTSNTWLNFLIQNLIGTLLLFSLYEFRLKGILSNLFEVKPDEFLKVKLKRIDRHYATKDEGNEIKITVQGETKEVNESAKAREAGWSLNIRNVNVNRQIKQANIKQSELTYKYELNKTYNLDISQSQYRCIETWKIVLESQLGKKEDLGFFVAKWNKSNSTKILDELDIKSIHWERNYEDSLKTIKEQLCDHLLISEEPELVATLDPNYKRRQNIPEYLRDIDLIRENLDKSLYLKQRKIVFPEIETITTLYPLGRVKAICGQRFLKILIDRNKLSDCLNVNVYERYFVESEEAEFRNFYQSLDNNSKSVFNNTSTLKIMVYQRDIKNIISSQDDFCIIEINDKPSMVVYTFTDNKHPNAGWISWREVDVRFYTNLYKSQIDKGHRIETVDSYLRNYSP